VDQLLFLEEQAKIPFWGLYSVGAG
jgi:hypothetical protein